MSAVGGRQLLVLMLGGAAPATIALALLWLPQPPPIGSLALRWLLSLVVVGGWLALVGYGRAAVVERLDTLTNVIGALREGEYSIRARSGGERAFAELGREINALAGTLRHERLAAREATAMVQKVIEELGAGVFAFDERRRLVLVNRTGARWLGIDRATLLGRSAAELGLDGCLEGGPRRLTDLELPHGHGRYEIRRAAFRSQGRPHDLLVLTDLTRALAAEERQAWQRMVQVLRHEINNSLAPIRSIASMLRDHHADESDELAEGLAVIVARSDALARIIASYKTLAGLPAPKPERFELRPWAERVARLESRVPVVVADSPDVAIVADRDQLEQLLINLLRNAAEATLTDDAGGRVEISWSVRDRRLELRVTDDGPGVAGGENLFVPFFTTKPEGSGIGLALSRQIAVGHGGRLALADRSEARGAVATLTLPLS